MWRSRLLFMLGGLVLIEAMLMIIPLVIAWLTGDDAAAGAFSTALLVACVTGSGAYFGFMGAPPARTPALTILLPIFSFFTLAAVAALPFFFFSPEAGAAAALFEGMSYLTTSGASAYPQEGTGIAFAMWRILLAWVGGFLAIIYALSLLTAVNSGGLQLHRSALPFGDSREGYSRLRSTASILFPVYILMTLIITLLMMATSGLSMFNSFGLAVSGLSTTALPINELGLTVSLAGQIVFALAMALGALNWDMLQGLFSGRKRTIFRDPEGRSLLFITIGGAAFFLIGSGSFNGAQIWSALFHSLSAVSGTGVRLEGNWFAPESAVAVGVVTLLLLAIGGGSASTTGGIGLLRLMALAKLGRAELDRLAHPNGVRRLYVGRAQLGKRDAEAIYLLLGGFMLTLIFGSLLLGIQGLSFQDSLALGFAALTLSGPSADMVRDGGLGYTALTNSDYLILTAMMAIGRVEATLVLALGTRIFWRR